MFNLPEYTQNLKVEVRKLRITNARLTRSADQNRDKAKRIEEDFKKAREKIRRLRKENDNLKKEIEKLTKTNKRYQVALFDHGNFKRDTKSGKAKGGQPGHADTNREVYESKGSYPRQRRYAKQCGKCGQSLKRVNSFKEKLLLDIVINPQIVKLLVETERQWCRKCKCEVQAKHPQSLPFTEYGINLFMMVLLLRFRCHLSLAKIAIVVETAYGLPIAKSVVQNLLTLAKGYLKGKYEELVQAVREGEVMYNDETGWMVKGRNAWMWIMANEEVTVYQAAESRGKGVFESLYKDSQAKSMHDGYASYESVTGEEKSLYCWSHILRFAFEETVHDPPGSEGINLRDELVLTFHLKHARPEWDREHLEQILHQRFDEISKLSTTTQTAKNIMGRVVKQKHGLINALLYTPDGTNNLAERELRGMAIHRSISNGSDTFGGMETTAILASVVRTLAKRTKDDFWNHLHNSFLNGIKTKHSQYLHLSFMEAS